MPNPNAIRPLSETPFVIESVVSDVPQGLITLREGERKHIRFQAKFSSKLSFELVIEVPEGAELVFEGAWELDTHAEVSQLIIIRGSGRVTVRQTATVALDATLLRRYVCDLSGDAMCQVDDDSRLVDAQSRIYTEVRSVLRDSARSTVRGRIVIGREASRSDVNMQLHHLLLGEKAFAASVPELLVQTDDVICRHGASISRPADAALSYLIGRGLAPEVARNMLAEAFLCPAQLL